ncbi:hypothetical protein VTP01DRAFT_2916 [Rhizomucor pusillus]|uniref:uncharacterized protein n=1 Tax=Rhizomucor pusillus TaxID=4840 RepID=UPI003742DEA8
MSNTKGSDAVTAEDSEDDFQTPIVPRKRAPKKLKGKQVKFKLMIPELLPSLIYNCYSSKRRKTTVTPTKRKKRIMTIKSSINGVSWEARYRSPLEKLVITVNEIPTHAYALARYIFLSEIHATEPGERFPMENWLETDFFAEVWLSLTLRTVKSSRTDGTTRYRGLIHRHIKNYLKHSGFDRKALTNSQQIARYEGSRICTAYLNSIKDCFDKSSQEIKEARYKQVTKPAHDVKQALLPSTPGNHALAYVMMAKFCEDHEIKTFQCMPLRTSWIPAHMQIDTKILATQMLKKPNNIDFDLDLWKQVVNFQSKPLQNQGAVKSMAFKGTIFTDGDSGFDLLYCMHQDSTNDAPLTCRYTKNTKAIDTKATQYKKLRQRIKRAKRNCRSILLQRCIFQNSKVFALHED